MDESRRLLDSNKTYAALERLKNILPKYEGTQNEWRIHELIGAAFHDLGDAEGAAQAYFNAAKCDKYLRSQRTHYSNYLFALHYLNQIDNDTLAQEHLAYNKLYKDQEHFNRKVNESTSSLLVIGYLAPNFLESSAARFYEDLIWEHDDDDFFVKCFSMSNERDEFTEHIRIGAFNNLFMLGGMSTKEAAQKIAEKGVDILVDLGGHTDGGITLQVMGYRPAPIQVSCVGWLDTTGLDVIDYIVTDNYLAPIGNEKYFSEKLLRVPSAFAFKPTETMTNKSSFNKVHSELTFGSFNNFMKVTDEYLKCVKKILSKVENSKFIMQDTTIIPARKIEMERRLQQLKMPLDRIEVRLGNNNYLDDYADIDIMLDTFPYNGCTMTATALYMGVPVISLYGTHHSSRFGANILRLAELTNLIANDSNHYVDLAVSLANDTNYLNDLKQNLRKKISESKLLATKSFVSVLEYYYHRMADVV